MPFVPAVRLAATRRNLQPGAAGRRPMGAGATLGSTFDQANVMAKPICTHDPTTSMRRER
jgi:hypothetical protein